MGARGRSVGAAYLRTVLVLLCVVLLAVTGYAWWRHQYALSTAPTGATITSVAARDAGLREAGPLTEQVLSYGWSSFESDVQEAAAVLAPTYRPEHARVMEAARERVVAEEVTVEATAVASSVVSASPGTVVALVFVDQATTARGIAGRRVDQARVLVTLTGDGGEWRVSGMRTF